MLRDDLRRDPEGLHIYVTLGASTSFFRPSPCSPDLVTPISRDQAGSRAMPPFLPTLLTCSLALDVPPKTDLPQEPGNGPRRDQSMARCHHLSGVPGLCFFADIGSTGLTARGGDGSVPCVQDEQRSADSMVPNLGSRCLGTVLCESEAARLGPARARCNSGQVRGAGAENSQLGIRSSPGQTPCQVIPSPCLG